MRTELALKEIQTGEPGWSPSLSVDSLVTVDAMQTEPVAVLTMSV